MSSFESTKTSLLKDSEIESIKLYLTLMHEAKARLLIVDQAIENKGEVPPWMVKEICYLQFRFMCEIVALSCLSAHGDLTLKNALKKTYEPRHIFKRLERLKPDFYPQPVKLVLEPGTTGIIADPSIPQFSKTELLKLWDEAGDILHRTPIARVHSASRTSVNEKLLTDINLRLAGLLASHWITLVDNRKGMHVMLAPADGMPRIDVLDFGGDGEGLQVRVSEFRFARSQRA